MPDVHTVPAPPGRRAPALPRPFRSDGDHIAVDLPGGRALFTTRRGGVSRGPFASLNLGLTAGAGPQADRDAPEAVLTNRGRVAAGAGLEMNRIAAGRQVHGTRVLRVREAPSGGWAEPDPGGAAEADGQATALAGVGAAVLTADCLPVALAAEGAVCMVHAGWRGLAGGVLEEGVRALRELGGAGAVAAAIGPGAGGCCYAVGEEVHEHFAGLGREVRRGPNLDLKAVATLRLRRAGVAEVHDVGLCTICSPAELFFSHRRDRGRTGRQAGLVWRT